MKNYKSIAFFSKKYGTELKRYSLLLIVPLLLGIILFLCVRNETSKQIEKTGSAIVQHFQAKAESVVRELQIVSDAILADGKISAVSKLESRPEDPLSVAWALGTLKSKSNYVENVYLLCPKQQTLYTNKAYYNYEGAPTVLLSESYIDIHSLDLNERNGWHVLNGNFAPPYYVTSISEDVTLIITLNKIGFIRTLQDNKADFCCMFNDSFSFTSLSANHPDVDWNDEKAVCRLLNTTVKCFYVHGNDFSYLAAIDIKGYKEPINIIVLVFVIYIIGVILFGVTYLTIQGKRRYNEMASIVNDLPSFDNNNSSYNEILEAIVTSLNNYKDSYKNNIITNKKNNMLSFLSGAYTNASDEQLSSAGLTRCNDGYYAIHMRVRGNDMEITTNSTKPVAIELTETILSSALTGAGSGKIKVDVAGKHTDYFGIISVLSPEVDDCFVKHVVAEALKVIENNYGIEVSAFIGAKVLDPSQLQESAQSADSLLHFTKTIDSDANVIIESDMENDAGIFLDGSFIKQIQTLAGTLQLKRYDIIPEMVEALLDKHVANIDKQHYKLAESRLESVKNLIIEETLLCSLSDAKTNELIKLLNDANSVSATNQAVLTICNQLSNLQQNSFFDDNISKACAYIKAHLSDANLSVPEVADAIGISVQHLSRLFRRKQNITAIEYINSVRIETAKEMLLKGDYTVSAISDSCGYNNTVTFTRNFKRHVGMTPSEYREINRQ